MVRPTDLIRRVVKFEARHLSGGSPLHIRVDTDAVAFAAALPFDSSFNTYVHIRAYSMAYGRSLKRTFGDGDVLFQWRNRTREGQNCLG